MARLIIGLLILLGLAAAGCNAGRGLAALIGGAATDVSQGCQYILDNTQDPDAPTYGGVQR